MSKKLAWIYSDIHSCNFVDTNIFGHSFVSKFSWMSHSGLHHSFTSTRPCKPPEIQIIPLTFEARPPESRKHFRNKEVKGCEYTPTSERELCFVLEMFFMPTDTPGREAMSVQALAPGSSINTVERKFSCCPSFDPPATRNAWGSNWVGLVSPQWQEE